MRESISYRIVVVSNRLPVVFKETDKGHLHFMPSPGGLVTALSPTMEERGGLWVGWPGTFAEFNLEESLNEVANNLCYQLGAVLLTEDEINKYYLGFANEILWPLFHDLQTRCNFDPTYWNAYQTVNHKFADEVAKNLRENDFIWVQDYQLMLVAKALRSMNVNNRIGFFLHTPFPSPDIWRKLPWRKQLLEALLEYDLIGFQTRNDRNNFIHCIEAIGRGFHVDTRKNVSTVKTGDREVGIGSFPISIDFRAFSKIARKPSVAEAAKRLRDTHSDQQIILGVDRLDYSKGIPEKLKAFRNALERFEDLRGRITLCQIAVPSRETIPEYQTLKMEIESLVGEINGVFTQAGWIPIHYMFRSLDRTELLAHYRSADIALVTSLKDGMNLVSKEYCAANVDISGVLILSECAGAATQLYKNALIVNPYDIEGIAEAIYQAYDMSKEERQWRMRKLRKSVARRDIFWWVDSFLKAVL
jgi:trehalose 6-phosphate synthase